jgi:hypothetical protein
MNPGDKLRVHIFDANLAGGGRALEVHIDDLSTGQSGSMQASAANGFMATIIGNCKGVPFNYEPEYDWALPQNIVPWAALLGGILTQYEIGHFTLGRAAVRLRHVHGSGLAHLQRAVRGRRRHRHA